MLLRPWSDLSRRAGWLLVTTMPACGTIDHQFDYWGVGETAGPLPACHLFGGIQKDFAWIHRMVGEGAAFDAEWLMVAPALLLELPFSVVGDLVLLPLTLLEQAWSE